MSDSHSLAGALLDVRKAYRLLHGYHRRMLDTAALLAEQFPGAVFHQTALGCSPFTSRRNPFERTYWAWDGTPLVSVSFLHVRHSGSKDADVVHRAGDYLLDIAFVADSEFMEATKNSNREPQPERFLSPEEATSYLVLLLIRAEEEQRGVSWRTVWYADDYPKETRLAKKWGSSPYCAHFQRVPMEVLTNRAAVAKIGTEFRTWALAG